MTDTFPEDIKNHLPAYLSPEQKEDLLNQIRNFPKINYYIHKHDQEVLQGDGWAGFTILDFVSGERKSVKGIVLSNSCDVDIQNERDLDVNVVFVPLVKIDNYEKLLRDAGLSEDRISSKIESIKQQRITSMVFFPKGGNLSGDYIANLDDIHSQPLRCFISGDKSKLFTLSQAGFYMFILKLSIHFCRFQEDVLRYDS
ncbi:hypothetical protein AQUSIP_21010 [Aquicella siphonis]|uniref:Uncharacterized protein n=1 Tax=Aquicella siphonis TaxID=254247 RepID=A0A5E4PJN1_9COXI|nr:hypothetical protein [Aquicella siphonis]VVC76775.1 hypothetical protein AQUSIP_21010 [Aquicella siphonis]